MDSETEFSLVEAPPPVQPAYNRRVANLLDEEKGRFHQKTKRKRCDTWHGDENKQESQLDPDIEQGLNTKRKFARLVRRNLSHRHTLHTNTPIQLP